MTSEHITRPQSRLAQSLTIWLVVLSLITTLIITSVQGYNRYQTEMAAIEAGFQEVQQVHLQALSDSLWAANYRALGLQLEGLQRLSMVAFAEVRENDKVVASAGREPDEPGIERTYPMTYAYRSQEVPIGQLRIVADLGTVHDRLAGEAINTLLNNALIVFLIAGFIFYFFHQQVTRHLIAVTEYVHALDPDANRPPLALLRTASRHGDELDDLVTSINRMRKDIEQSVAALRDSERRYRDLVEFAPDGIFIADLDGRYTSVNSAGSRMLGYKPGELVGKSILDLIAAEDVSRLEQEKLALLRGVAQVSEWNLRRKDGSFLPVEVSAKILQDGRWQGFVRDIAERKEATRILANQMVALERSEERQRQLLGQSQEEQARMVSLLSAMSIGILFEDVNKRVLYHNPAFRRVWLIPEDVDLKGRNTRDVLELSANVLAHPDHFSRHILQVLSAHEVSDGFEIVMADGRVVTQLSYPVQDAEGRFIGRLWIYEDVTRERQTAEQLIYLAERDSLTGLYNRHRFQDELSRTLVETDRRKLSGALLFFDLDEFKYINDNFGHRAGDAMLIRVAGEVGALVRRNEILARLGGDEFAVLIPDATELEAVQLAERIIRAVAQIPFRFEGQNLRLTTSLGIAMYPEHGSNAEDLVAHADAAMYQAKEAGKNAWRVYRADLDASREMLGRLTWQERIASALDNNLFQLHFQGVYRAADGTLSHVEALVRMKDESGSGQVIMPGHFIAIAEKTGQIARVDRWVIREVAQLLAHTPTLPAVAVNVSGRSFDDPQMPQFIADTLRDAGVAPDRLIVELTETAAVSDLHDAQRFIEALHANGSRVCLDDFGTGFASFAYLKYLRAEVLKIDGLFVRNLPNDHDNQVFVKSIVDVARGLRKTTIAEFVEDGETLQMLRHFGVDMVQGYHLDMPRPDHPALGAAKA